MLSSRLIIVIFAICANFLFISDQIYASTVSCKEKIEICKWIKKVVTIKTPTMIASGILLSNSLVVTNKHVIEDNKYLLVKLPNKKIVKAETIPNNHPADLAFIKLNDKKLNFNFEYKNTNLKSKVRMVAFDIGRNDIRIYPESNILSYPDYKNKQSRIHSNSQNLPGTSGGALINETGDLIGIIASGGGEYNEAIPSNFLLEVFNLNGNESNQFYNTGKFMRLCADTLELSQQTNGSPDNKLVRSIQINCESANNKLFLDMAGQAMGKFGFFKDSQYFLEKSIGLDPKSPTSLHSLAITLHMQKLYKEEVYILKRLLDYTPEDPQALRLAIQAAGFSKNKEFADYAIQLMKQHNPGAVNLAEDFLESVFKSIQ